MYHLPKGTVTFLFTDIEGSTHLQQQLGDRYAGVLEQCRQLLRAAFRVWNSHEVDTQGDAFFVAFARATDAVSAAVDIQRALAAHAWPNGVIVRVRMGLHTGEPALGPEGYVGLDVARGARIMSAGHGGQVLLSQTTRDIVEYNLPGGVSLQDLGAHRLKDLQHPSHLFQLVIADLPADFPPLQTLDSHPNNLPIQPTALIGREKEVAAVERLLGREDIRLVTLTGPGGIGKTRLGLQVAAELADRFPNGVYFVNLAPLSDPEFVVPTIAQALAVKEIAGQSLLDQLKAWLREKQLLILLDNFEQVVGAAGQVASLLAACANLKMVVTSRMTLRVQAEHEFAVPPLALPDPKHLPDLGTLSQYEAVALFLQRAQAVKPEFQVTDAGAPAIAEICIRLDGLPLAIELAAARIKLLPPQALLARLGQRLEVLTSGARDAPVRQQSLRNTIAWSYELLHAEEQRLFRRLSVFCCGCTLEAIEAVCAALDKSNGTERVLDGVASLIDKSLLQQPEQERDEPRILMLETIREYGLEVLAASGEMGITRQAHATYYLRLSQEAEPELDGPQQAMWLEQLEQEHDNLRTALSWWLEQGETGQSMEMALRLGAALEQFWMIRGHYSEGRIFLERALAGREGVAKAVQAKALGTAAWLAINQGDTDRGEVLCEESLSLWQDLGDTTGIALSLQRLAVAAWVRNNPAVARSLMEEALARWKEVGDKRHVAWVLTWLAYMASQQGEYARALALCEESLVIYRELESKIGIAGSLGRLTEVLSLSQSDPARVRSLLEEALALSREVGDKLGIAHGQRFAGQLALSQGDTTMARSLIEEALALFREIGNREGMALSLSLLARVETGQGNRAAARTLYEESLTMASKGMGDKGALASSLEGLASLVAAQGELVRAARFWGAAEGLRETIGTPIPPVERTGYERTVASACAQLGKKAFAAAWAEGRTMSPEQVLATQGQVALPTPGELSSSPTTASPPAYPNRLTAREVEVLRVVAQGLTNEQVAERLVISPRTVDTHLTSIYSKIGVSSRSAATRYAIEHHLV
jgi:predicted ATPase/class 3 adenylate cyclase/DNA-binding CsgD family transcriptional regulator